MCLQSTYIWTTGHPIVSQDTAWRCGCTQLVLMGVWSIAIESATKVLQSPWLGQFSWTEQTGGLPVVRQSEVRGAGAAPAPLSSRIQLLANNGAARFSTLARHPASPRRCATGYAALDVDKDGPLLDGSDNGRHARYESRVSVETVSMLCDQGRVTEAVEALGVLVQTNCCVSKALLYIVLKNCVVKRDLVLGRRVHAFTVEQGYQSDTFLCNHILRMYAAHGRLQDAMDVFAVVGDPDAFTWSAIISACVKHGRDREALQLYHQMCRSSVKPDGHVFVAALQACARGADLETGQQVHADVLASGVEPDPFVSSCLVDMYAKCGSLDAAQSVFEGISHKDVVTWTAMIAGYSKKGLGHEALRVYSAMLEAGAGLPDSVTFVCLLQACASGGNQALEKGRQLHALIRERGYQADVIVANSLVNMYAKCGSLEDAQRVFQALGQKDVVTWNAMLAGYAQQGMGPEALHLYSVMQQEGVSTPDSMTFLCLLQACASVGTPALSTGKQLHAQIRQQGHEADVFLANSLVNMYVKCGSLDDARRLFEGLSGKDVVTWTALVAGYSQQGMGQEALRLYSSMKEEAIVIPNSLTFVWLLQACASGGTPALEMGKQLHAQIREQGLQADVYLASSLVNMYAKCGSLEDAQEVFDRLCEKDVVTWTALIAGYSKQGMGQEALCVYREMLEEGVAVPNSVTFLCLLQACASVGIPALETGKQLHVQIRAGGHEADVVVANSLVNMYANCGSIVEARRLFNGLAQKDVVTWNAMITGYSKQGMGLEALHMYDHMQEAGIDVPNSVTFVSLLQACASLGTQALEKGKQVHVHIRERGHEVDTFVANSLVNMYAKCGSLDFARRVFDGLGEKDVVTWNAILTGYSQQGMGQEALCLYSAMQEKGKAVPDTVTFVCLLQACANVAALHLGRQLHAQIEEQGLQANLFVAGSLINMYGKCGSMVDAQQVFDALPERDNVAWSSLIAGYTCQGDSHMVLDLVQRMREGGVQPIGITFLSLLRACSHAGLVNKGEEHFEAMSRQYGITPTVEHYTCMVDLLGRAGRLEEALALVRTMPVLPTAPVWHTLLGACRKWNDFEVGRHAFDQAVQLDRKDAAAYVSMWHIYAGAQMWEQAQEMQGRRKSIGAWKQPGQSWWADMDGQVHSFLVGDSCIQRIRNESTEGRM